LLEINKIYNEDCLIGMKKIDNKSIDMILCDLPYGTTKNKWDTIIPIDPLWEQYERIIKDDGAIVLTASQPFTSMLVMSKSNLFRYSLVWQKTTPTGFLNAKRMPLRAHEDILVFYKSLPTYNPQKTTGHVRKVSKAEHKTNCVKTSDYGEHGLTTYDSTERYPTSVLTFKTDKQKEAFHPTQKPIALFEYLIKTYTNEKETVLDNCIGSGTTAIACLNTRRNYIGFETNMTYCDVAYKRIQNTEAEV
jgi:DNA modification methylase